MAYSPIPDSKTFGFSNHSSSKTSAHFLQTNIEDHINQLYNKAGFSSCANNLSIHAKLFELLKKHKKHVPERAVPP